jgi:hypothetical protein
MRYTLVTRYMSKGIQGLRNSVNRVPENVLLGATVGAVLATQISGSFYVIADAPSEALGSLVTGTIGSSVASTAATAATIWVADTTMDRVYPASYARLPPASSAPEWRVVQFSLLSRST